jgi:hypothetical protein
MIEITLRGITPEQLAAIGAVLAGNDQPAPVPVEQPPQKQKTRKTPAAEPPAAEPPAAEPPAAEPPAAEPPAAKIATLEEVRAVLAELSRAGKAPQAKQLIASAGAEKLTEVDPSQFATILSAAKELLK